MRAGMLASGIAALAIWGVTGTVSPATAGVPAPLSITSDRLDMDDRNQVATFMGHVVADDGRMRLSADRMTVRYDKKAKTTGGVKEVKAEGQVVIQQDRDRGTADVVNYQFDKHTLELVGNDREASIRRGDDQLTGRRILVTLDEEQRISKVSVQGGENRRVSARITPSGLMQRVEGPIRSDGSPARSAEERPVTPPTAALTPTREMSPPPQPPPPPRPAIGGEESSLAPPAARDTTARRGVVNDTATPVEPESALSQEEESDSPSPKPRRRSPQPPPARR
ncbi:MAG: lipopolysaccharide transport periplasmic protein LptA [Magnetococcales bacterium]|nr:lipopolysaccharide transport periplasmic protein LptA [Magnetococcales bacterium]